MKRTNTIAKLITLTIAMLAVIGFNWTPGPVAATGQSESQNNLKQMTLGIFGFVPGQTLRFSVFNPNTPEQQRGKISCKLMLVNAGGNHLALSDEVDLPPGQLRSFDFNRVDLALAGEPGTGHVQVRAEIIYRYTDSPIPPENFTVSTEIFDNRSGETKVYQTGSVGWVKISPDA